MGNPNKKRSEVNRDGRISGKKIRSKKDRTNGGVTADDAELDEFLAILNRLQAGFKNFQEKGVGKAVVKPPVTDSGSWNPAFELDDFNKAKEEGGLKMNVTQKDDVVGFDLNADPVSDQKSDD